MHYQSGRVRYSQRWREKQRGGSGRKESSFRHSFFFVLHSSQKEYENKYIFEQRQGSWSGSPLGVRGGSIAGYKRLNPHRFCSPKSSYTHTSLNTTYPALSFDKRGRALNQMMWWATQFPNIFNDTGRWSFEHFGHRLWQRQTTAPPVWPTLLEIVSVNNEKGLREAQSVVFALRLSKKCGNMRKLMWCKSCWIALYLLPDTEIMP